MTSPRTLRSAGLALALALVVGCAMQQHRAQVRHGFLTRGLHREAFVREWGPPSRTFTLQGKEPVLRVTAWGSYLEKPVYDVWEYRERYTCLVFDGVRLVSWETGNQECDPRLVPNVALPAEVP
jgi:hypothetical protein